MAGDLGEFEQLILLAPARLGEDQGLVRSFAGEPEPVRGIVRMAEAVSL